MSVATDGMSTGEAVGHLEAELIEFMRVLLEQLFKLFQEMKEEDAQRILDELSVEKVALEDFENLREQLTVEKVNDAEFVSEMNGLFKGELTVEKITQAIEQSKPTPEIEQSKIGLDFLADLTGGKPIELEAEKIQPELSIADFSFERIAPTQLQPIVASPVEITGQAPTLILTNESAAVEAPDSASSLRSISPLELQEILAASSNYWAAKGLDADSLELLKIPEGKIADLSNTDLSDPKLAAFLMTGDSADDRVNLKNVNLHRANLEGVNLTNADLSGAKLSDVNLSEADLKQVNFEGANLIGANLAGANLAGANLAGANLAGASLQDSNLDGANLEGVNLKGADLRGVNLDNVELIGANLDGAIFHDSQLPKQEVSADIEEVWNVPKTARQIQIEEILTESNLFFETEGAEGTIADLSTHELKGISFRGMDAMGVNFSEVDARLVDFTGADLANANFSNAELVQANLESANLEAANLQGADLQGATLKNANLKGADLRGANLQGVNLQGADLQGAMLENVNLEGANLKRANLDGANLDGANFEGVNLDGVDLSGVIFNEKIISEAEWTKQAEYGSDLFPNRIENSLDDDDREEYLDDPEYTEFQDFVEEIDESNPDRYNQVESNQSSLVADVKVFKTTANDDIAVGDGSIITVPKETVLVYGKDADGSIVNTLSDAEVEAIVQILNSPIDGNVAGGENLRVRYKGEILAETDANGNVVINELAGLDLPENFTEKLREALGQNRQEPILETPSVKIPVVEAPAIDIPALETPAIEADRASKEQIESLLDYANQWVPPGSSISKDSSPVTLSSEQLDGGVLIALTDKADGELKLLVREDNSVDVIANKLSPDLQEQLDKFPTIIEKMTERGKYDPEKSKDFTINEEAPLAINPLELIADMEARLAEKQLIFQGSELDSAKAVEINEIQAQLDFMKALYTPSVQAVDEAEIEFDKDIKLYEEKGGSGAILAGMIENAVTTDQELELPGKDISVKGVGKDHHGVKVMTEWMQANQSETGFSEVNGYIPSVVPDEKGNLNYILEKDGEIVLDAKYNLASHTMMIDKEATPITPELREVFAEMKQQLANPVIETPVVEVPVIAAPQPVIETNQEQVTTIQPEVAREPIEATNEQIESLADYVSQYIPPGSVLSKGSSPVILSTEQSSEGVIIDLVDNFNRGQVTLLVDDRDIDVLTNRNSPDLDEQLNKFPEIIEEQKAQGNYVDKGEFVINGAEVEKTVEQIRQEAKTLAGQENLTTEQIDLLLKHDSPEVRKEMAKRADLDPEQVDLLAGDSVHFVREEVSQRDDLTPAQIDAFSKDQVQQIRKNMAQRDDLSPEQADVLSNDSNAQVREFVNERMVASEEISIDPDKLNGLAKWLADAEMTTHELSGGVTANVGLTTEDVKACIFIDGDSGATVLLENDIAVIQPASTITPNISAAIAEVCEKVEEISLDIEEVEVDPEKAIKSNSTPAKAMSLEEIEAMQAASFKEEIDYPGFPEHIESQNVSSKPKPSINNDKELSVDDPEKEQPKKRLTLEEIAARPKQVRQVSKSKGDEIER